MVGLFGAFPTLVGIHSFGPPPEFEPTCASERGLGAYAHARDVVLARARMTCVSQAVVCTVSCMIFFCCVCVHVCILV